MSFGNLTLIEIIRAIRSPKTPRETMREMCLYLAENLFGSPIGEVLKKELMEGGSFFDTEEGKKIMESLAGQSL